jgi:hypothetical protein
MKAPRRITDGVSRVKISSRMPCLWLANVGDLKIESALDGM